MKAFPASAVTRNASDLLEAAAVAPVVITRHHKPRFVIMSVEHYEGPAQKAAGHRRRSGEGVIVMKDSPGTLPQKRPWQLLVVGDGGTLLTQQDIEALTRILDLLPHVAGLDIITSAGSARVSRDGVGT